MACCPCGVRGVCKRCACVKDGRLCSDCQPSRLGNCQNSGESSSSRPPENNSQSPENNSPLLHVVYAAERVCSSNAQLPAFSPLATPVFTRGSVDAQTFTSSLLGIYDEVMGWRKNCFKIPQGKIGTKFVAELTRLFDAFASRSALESIALRAATVMPILLLQKPSSTSKSKDHNECLKRRMALWKEGDLSELVREGRTLQHRLLNSRKPPSLHAEQQLSRTFAKLMFEGKTHAAIRLLSDGGKGGFLSLDDVADKRYPADDLVRDVLKKKHPAGRPASPDAVIQGSPPDFHPVVFDALNADLIRSVSLHTSGAAGPSYLDAFAWRRLCTSFGTASDDLCNGCCLVC